MTRTIRRAFRPLIALAAGLAVVLATPTYVGAETFIEPDVTPPTITIVTPGAGAGGWHTDVPFEVHVQVADLGSGASGLQSARYSVTGAQTQSEDISQTGKAVIRIDTDGWSTVSVQASDEEGNRAATTVGVGLDRGRPIVTFTGRVTAGAVFAQDERVVLEYACSDEHSGIVGCEGPVPSGSLLDTRQLGVNKTVEVTATDRVGLAQTRSVSYSVVEARLDVRSPVTVSGTGVVAEELSGVAGEFTPAPDRVTHAWHRDGEPIPGAIGLGYRPRAADVGHAVTLVATAERAGFADGRSESAPITVTPGELQMSGSPTLHGEVRVGGELTVDHAPVLPADATTTYRWFRGSTQIPGADQPTYRLQLADAGHQLKAFVDAQLDGYHGESFSTERTVTVPGYSLIVTGQPTVSGTARAGETLTASLPTFAPDLAAPGTAVETAVQWLRDGQPIPGATGPTHTLGAADVGRALSVRATATAAGHNPVALTSEPTAATAKAVTSLKVTAKANRRVVVLILRASAKGVAPAGSVVVKARGKVVARTTLKGGVATVRVKGLRPGRTTFTASYGGDSVTTPVTAKASAKVRRR